MSLKAFIQNNIVSPVAVSRGETFHRVAVVTRVDEINNVCSILYVDKDAVESNKDNVPVRIYSPGIQDWFPEVEDVVAIDEIDGTPIIVGLPEVGYSVNIRSHNELESDILSDTISGSTEGGYVY